jgi:hypothetical protein
MALGSTLEAAHKVSEKLVSSLCLQTGQPVYRYAWALFLTNALTYGPLMQIFKASKEGKYAMKLGYSFVASFQGVVFIAWWGCTS